METKQTPKELPHSTTKAGLMSMYLDQMSESDIRVGINTIIADLRKGTPLSTTHSKKIFHNELKEFVSTYGMPKGFVKPKS